MILRHLLQSSKNSYHLHHYISRRFCIVAIVCAFNVTPSASTSSVPSLIYHYRNISTSACAFVSYLSFGREFQLLVDPLLLASMSSDTNNSNDEFHNNNNNINSLKVEMTEEEHVDDDGDKEFNSLWSDAIEGMIDVPGYAEKVLYLAPKPKQKDRDEHDDSDLKSGLHPKWPEPFLNGRRVFCLTGHNPMGQTFPEEHNHKANLALQQRIADTIFSSSMTPYAQWHSFGFHITEGWQEDGFALSFDVIDVKRGRNLILKLAKEFQQAAIYEYYLDLDQPSESDDLRRKVIWCNPQTEGVDESPTSMKILQREEIPSSKLAKGIIL